MRFWVSWISTEDDFRPLTYPPNEAILGWWRSGYTSEGNAILCAVVDAKDGHKAAEAIYKDFPEAKKWAEWRFFETKPDDWKPGDRFPLDDKWVRQRFGV